jgi:hypothetical protein
MQGKYSRKRATGTLAVVICAVVSIISLTSVAQASANSSVNYGPNYSDPNCPAWSIGTPYYGYGTVADSVGVFCVQGFSGDNGGRPFSYSRGLLIAHLILWRHTASGYTAVASKTAPLTSCFNQSVNYNYYIPLIGNVHVTSVRVCGGSLLANTGVNPSPGNYHGELEAYAEGNDGHSSQLLDDANSYGYCFYC